LMTGCLQTSSNYLGAQFLHRTQLSFRQYLRLVRTRRAVELLRSRDLSIHRVAAALGHADAAHFTREIRAELGVPPRVLRQVFGHRNSHPSAGGG
jgi:AraC-like DNA-binding protein